MSYVIATTAPPEGEYYSTAYQMIVDVLRLISMSQIRVYLTAKGWKLDENYPDKNLQVYILADPEESDHPFIVPLPVNPQSRRYLVQMQEALERLADIEDTTFLTIVCRILQVGQIVLMPE